MIFIPHAVITKYIKLVITFFNSPADLLFSLSTETAEYPASNLAYASETSPHLNVSLVVVPAAIRRTW